MNNQATVTKKNISDFVKSGFKAKDIEHALYIMHENNYTAIGLIEVSYNKLMDLNKQIATLHIPVNDEKLKKPKIKEFLGIEIRENMFLPDNAIIFYDKTRMNILKVGVFES